MSQGTEIPADHKDHVPAPAPVSAGRSAPGNKFFPSKGGAAVAASTGGYLDQGFIGEFLHALKITENRRKSK
jgi:hypothetical protein